MNIEEIMIGDWVFNKHHQYPIRITPFDFFTHTHDKYGEQHLMASSNVAFGRDFEPIPVTGEILKKNGFEISTDVGYVFEDYKTTVIYSDFYRQLKILKEYNVVFDSGKWSNICVHEMQHALRLCKVDKDIEI